jgi:hypothetical protein
MGTASDMSAASSRTGDAFDRSTRTRVASGSRRRVQRRMSGTGGARAARWPVRRSAAARSRVGGRAARRPGRTRSPEARHHASPPCPTRPAPESWRRPRRALYCSTARGRCTASRDAMPIAGSRRSGAGDPRPRSPESHAHCVRHRVSRWPSARRAWGTRAPAPVRPRRQRTRVRRTGP